MLLWEILHAVLLGIVQGITEFLPISSTGHMILVDSIWPMDMSQEFTDLFLVVIQLGSILAVIVLYFRKLWPFIGTKEEKKSKWRLWGKILVAVIPAAAAGYLLDDVIDQYLYNPLTVAITLIAYGILFIAVENARIPAKTSSLEQISVPHALGIGGFQTLALIPGTSRSGATILGGVMTGCARDVAAEFSFFLAIPTMLGASLLKIVKFTAGTSGFTRDEGIVLAVGTAVAFLVSMWAVRFLMKYLKSHDFKAFGWYRIALGAAVIAYFLFVK